LFESGALGIGLASVLINYMYSAADDHLFNIVTGLMSGASPMLAGYFAVDLFRLDATLTGLNARVLFKISVLFALISAVLHQMWFFLE
jgi:heme O synthase-like polyprenyltransferase